MIEVPSPKSSKNPGSRVSWNGCNEYPDEPVTNPMAQTQSDTVSAPEARSESIEELFSALESPLLGYAVRLLGDRGIAEDVVQEAFMRLHASFAEVKQPRQWLYRTVHNLALNHHRDNRKIVRLETDEESAGKINPAEQDSAPLPDELIARWEGIGLVRLSLEGLDARSRELIRLKFTEDLSYREISEKTGLSVSNVGYLLHHALKSIAADLAKSGIQS